MPYLMAILALKVGISPAEVRPLLDSVPDENKQSFDHDPALEPAVEGALLAAAEVRNTGRRRCAWGREASLCCRTADSASRLPTACWLWDKAAASSQARVAAARALAGMVGRRDPPCCAGSVWAKRWKGQRRSLRGARGGGSVGGGSEQCGGRRPSLHLCSDRRGPCIAHPHQAGDVRAPKWLRGRCATASPRRQAERRGDQTPSVARIP